MLTRALLTLRRLWRLALEIDVRYTSAPMWSPWRDFNPSRFGFNDEKDLESSR
jgi:hypothetical protein